MKGKIKKIAVIGAGTMGHGIAQSFAQGGYQVSMMSRTQKTLDRAMALIHSSLSAMAEEGVLDPKSIPSILGRITSTTSIEEASRDADIAFETMAEDKEAKKEIFAQLDKYCPPEPYWQAIRPISTSSTLWKLPARIKSSSPIGMRLRRLFLWWMWSKARKRTWPTLN